MVDQEEARLRAEAQQLAGRIIRDVLMPYLREHQSGQHGPADAADCRTVVATALAHAVVPQLIGLSHEDRETMVAFLAVIALEEAEAFEASGGAGLPAGQVLQ